MSPLAPDVAARLAAAEAVQRARSMTPVKPGTSPGPLDNRYARAAVDAALHAAAPALVRELFARVDGGWCLSCTREACEALAVVFPDVPWVDVFDRLDADRGL